MTINQYKEALKMHMSCKSSLAMWDFS